MNTQEIKDLIARKIAGQGTQVDAGGALPEILNEILDKAEEGGGSLPSGGTTGQVLTKKSDADGDAEWRDAGGVFVDVDELPESDITKERFYRKSPEDVYIYQRQALDTNTIVWYGDGPNGFIEVVDDSYFTAYDADGDPRGDYIIEGLTTQEVNSLLNSGIIAVKDSFAESKFFGTPDFFGFSDLVTIEKGEYKLYHNPTSSPGEYIEVGGKEIVVKRYEKKDDVPLEIRPIDANIPVSVTIPLSELGLDTSYDVVAVQRVGTRAGRTAPTFSLGFVIVVDYWIMQNGGLVISLVSSRTSVNTTYGLSFNAYFVKK